MAHTRHIEKEQLEQLEKEVAIFEEGVISGTGNCNTWGNKRRALSSFMNERAKGALVRAKMAVLS